MKRSLTLIVASGIAASLLSSCTPLHSDYGVRGIIPKTRLHYSSGSGEVQHPEQKDASTLKSLMHKASQGVVLPYSVEKEDGVVVKRVEKPVSKEEGIKIIINLANRIAPEESQLRQDVLSSNVRLTEELSVAFLKQPVEDYLVQILKAANEDLNNHTRKDYRIFFPSNTNELTLAVNTKNIGIVADIFYSKKIIYEGRFKEPLADSKSGNISFIDEYKIPLIEKEGIFSAGSSSGGYRLLSLKRNMASILYSLASIYYLEHLIPITSRHITAELNSHENGRKLGEEEILNATSKWQERHERVAQAAAFAWSADFYGRHLGEKKNATYDDLERFALDVGLDKFLEIYSERPMILFNKNTKI